MVGLHVCGTDCTLATKSPSSCRAAPAYRRYSERLLVSGWALNGRHVPGYVFFPFFIAKMELSFKRSSQWINDIGLGFQAKASRFIWQS